MAFKGQPISTTQVPVTRAKISDGKSVRLKVPSGKTVVAQQFYLINGFFGVAMQSGSEGDEIVLQIEQAEYETDNIVTSEAFTLGEKIYWDDAESKFTTTANDRLVGRVTDPKDSNNTIWFILLPQQ